MKKLLLYSLLWLYSSAVLASKVDTIKVYSRSMSKTISNIAIIPDNYIQSPLTSYPVIYLLHGATGDFTNWTAKVSDIQGFVDLHQLIVICPDGGYTSWYFDSPIDPKMQYETYMTKELLPWVDKNYRTIKHKKGRAITGLSMGGHGALYLALRHQDLWGAAGSMSGGVDIRPFPNNWDIAKRLGKYAENPKNWESNTVINMLHLLDKQAPELIIDCGVDDFFYQVNQNLHRAMVLRNIPHDYIVRPGKHNWAYWENAVKYQILFFAEFFRESK